MKYYLPMIPVSDMSSQQSSNDKKLKGDNGDNSKSVMYKILPNGKVIIEGSKQEFPKQFGSYDGAAKIFSDMLVRNSKNK